MTSFKSPELIIDGKIVKVIDTSAAEVSYFNKIGMLFLC